MYTIEELDLKNGDRVDVVGPVVLRLDNGLELDTLVGIGKLKWHFYFQALSY